MHTICSVRHVLVEQVAVVLHVVGEEVGGGAHHQAVPVHGVVEAAGGEAEDLLVDVQEAEVHVGLVAHHPPGHVPHPLVGIVDKHLERNQRKILHYCDDLMTNLLSPRGCGEAGMFPVILANRYSPGQNLLTKIEGENWQQHILKILVCLSPFYSTQAGVSQLMCFGILPSGPLEPSGKYSSGFPPLVVSEVPGLVRREGFLLVKIIRIIIIQCVLSSTLCKIHI